MRGIDITALAEALAQVRHEVDCGRKGFDWDSHGAYACCVNGGSPVAAVRMAMRAMAEVIDTAISPVLAQQLEARFEEAVERMSTQEDE